MDNMAFKRLESLIIDQCEKNGHPELESKLQVSIKLTIKKHCFEYFVIVSVKTPLFSGHLR